MKGSLEEGLTNEARLFGRLCDTQDMKEGLKAFLEKRQPKFQDK
jgi:enoyl-CoA hydratase/carnithine racemase